MLAALLLAGAEPLPLREALSGIMGSISLVSWIFLLIPQVTENYRNGSAEGVSVAFITIWILGDIANLIGALWGRLLSTVIALAIYFCVSDVILLSQTIYYNHVTDALAARRERAPCSTPADLHSPTQPLLARPRRKSSGAKSRHRRSSSRRPASLSAILRRETSASMTILRNILVISSICFAGTLGWFVAWRSGAWSTTEKNDDNREMPGGAEMLGYLGALLYLGDSIFLTALQILCHSSDRTYIKDNLPWLIGSLGTMSQDVIIFIQFHIYSRNSMETTQVCSAAIYDEN